MTYLLHLETATKVCSVALSCNGELIALREESTQEYSHSEKLTIFIQEVVQEAGITLRNLHGVSVASGPGSYTGLRIGVSSAKGLCYALDIPLISVDALVSMAKIAQKKYPEQTLCPLIDARRMEVYCGIYSSDLTLLKPISADIIDENSYAEFEPFVYFGDGAEKLSSIWESRKCLFDASIHASAIGQIETAYKKFLSNELEDVAYFEPFYLKDFVSTQK
jgi:tRNA threonylcarbamoyladenosine biosynthesis protein TsaB